MYERMALSTLLIVKKNYPNIVTSCNLMRKVQNKNILCVHSVDLILVFTSFSIIWSEYH